MFSIKKIRIRDFKSIKDRTFQLSDLHEIFGRNAVGKTSVQEAAQFACEGGKGDINKIRTGANSASVELVCERSDGVPLEILTSLDREGRLMCQARLGGTFAKNPRTLIKGLISFGAFNPRELLDKKTRNERILKLLPIRLGRKDVVMSDGAPFPVQNWASVPFGEHAWQALKAIDADLRHWRLRLYQKKDELVKAARSLRTELAENNKAFFAEHGVKPGELRGVETAAAAEATSIERQKGHIERAKRSEDSASEARMRRRKCLNAVTEMEAEAERFRKKIEAAKEALAGLERGMEDSKRGIVAAKKKAEENEKTALDREGEAKAARREAEEEAKKGAAFAAKIGQAREAGLIRQKTAQVADLEAKAEDGIAAHDEADRVVKRELPALIKNTLAPVTRKVAGLTLSETGAFSFHGAPLDTLSGSEIVRLGMTLYALDKKGKFIFLNEAECLDSESMEAVADKAQAEGMQVVALRVADKPAGGKWKSEELKGEAK